LLWGGWLVVTGLVFSYMQGTIHPYYTVALAPAIAALAALAAHAAWQRRATIAGRLTGSALVCAAGLWSFVLLGRTSGWQPELRWLVLALTVLAALGLAAPIRRGLVLRGLLASGLAAALIGTAAFGVATAASPHSGSIPSAGPAAAASAGGGMPSGSAGGMPSGSGSRPGGSASPDTSSGSMPSAAGGTSAGGTTASTALTNALKATSSTWAAAVVGDQSAAGLELSSGKAVMSIGGWSGTDNSPTLAQFEHYVATGQVRYLIASGGTQGGMRGGSSGVAAQILTWVEAHYKKVTIGGQTVYDLSQAA
jgi:4-amino-4-deoxy-L-arabinose transferase-like glycosyltransferase